MTSIARPLAAALGAARATGDAVPRGGLRTGLVAVDRALVATLETS